MATLRPMGGQAAVAAGDRQTVEAAVTVLRAGGNAVDAAIGAGFAAAVAEPGLTSLGGGGFLLTRQPTGETQLLDFFVDVPGLGLAPAEFTPDFTPVTVVFSDAEQVFHAGFGSIAVPGVLNGYLEAHRRLGRLPLSVLVRPATTLASEGAVLSPTQAEVLRLLQSIFTLTPQAAELFLPRGEPPTVGGRFHNIEYAEFLDQLGRLDPRGWTEIAATRELLSHMQTRGGLLTSDDLEAYQVRVRDPHHVGYRGARLTTNPPPSFGGSIVCAALAMLDAPVHRKAPHPLALAEALHHATDAQKAQRAGASSSQGTTHVSVIDADGMVASMTTSNGSCSGVLVPGTGVQLNNMMGEADLHPDGFHDAASGTRVASMMSPSLLDLADGSVVALGSGGSERIRSALLQTVTNLVAGSSLDEAVAAPRVHFDGTTYQLEPDVALDVAVALEEAGPVNRWSQGSMYFGGVNAVRRHPDGRLEATGDARRQGASAVIDV